MAFVGLFYGAASFSAGFLTLAPIIWLSGLATHSWHPPAMGLLRMRFENRKGFALGVHGTGANMGQTLAPIIAGYLLLIMSWRGVLLANTIPLFATAILLCVCLEPFQIRGNQKSGSSIRPADFMNALIKNPGMIGACVFSGVRTLAHNVVSIFLPILLVRKYGVGPSTLGLALGVYSAASIFPETIVGYLSDKDFPKVDPLRRDRLRRDIDVHDSVCRHGNSALCLHRIGWCFPHLHALGHLRIRLRGQSASSGRQRRRRYIYGEPDICWFGFVFSGYTCGCVWSGNRFWSNRHLMPGESGRFLLVAPNRGRIGASTGGRQSGRFHTLVFHNSLVGDVI